MTTIEVRRLKPDRLDRRFRSLRLRCPSALNRLRELVQREGVRDPLLASDAVEADALVLVDGFKRLEIAEELGFEAVVVRIACLSVTEAQAAIVTSNSAKKGLTQLEEGWVVASLHRKHGLTQVEIAVLMGRGKSWVCRRLQLVERLADGVQQQVKEGLISASSARELVRLPRGNQTEVAQVAARQRLTSRELGALVEILLGSPSWARVEILTDPRGFLNKGEPEADGNDARLSAQANRLRKLLLRFESVANRVHEFLRQATVGSLTQRDLEILRSSSVGGWDRAARAVVRLGPLLLNPHDTRNDDE